ncbi:MAG: hypothetical protein HZB56_21305 [Deltaproteobacteria bacterium]|nr:hypothetical protein [Deltaproteobacteria bacterium]
MERMRYAALAVLALWAGTASAEQRLGVDVYRRAEFLASRTALVKQSAGVEAACYRTADKPDAVQSYYLKSQGFARQEGNVLRRGQVDVVLHPPAANPRTGVVSRYTVFCIMQAVD